MDDYASAFGFREWPFRIVVDESFARVWADRSDIREDLEKRMRRMKGLPHSTVQLMWADFGAGKSHSLRHIEWKCMQDPDRKLIPIYTEVPVGLDGLITIYRQLAGAIPPDLLQEASRSVVKGSIKVPASQGGQDLWQALRAYGTGASAAQSIAAEWLRAPAKNPSVPTLKTIGITSRIEDETRIVEVVAALVHLVHSMRPGASLVWLVDEYQRTADLTVRKREAFAKGLVTLFNSCTSGLHLVLSFSVAQQETALHLIPQDLRSRARGFPVLALPYLDRANALAFCHDLFSAFRSDAVGSAAAPFTPESLELVIKAVETTSAERVTPRVLMELLSAVLLEIRDSTPSEDHIVLPLSPETVAATLSTIPGSSV